MALSRSDRSTRVALSPGLGVRHSADPSVCTSPCERTTRAFVTPAIVVGWLAGAHGQRPRLGGGGCRAPVPVRGVRFRSASWATLIGRDRRASNRWTLVPPGARRTAGPRGGSARRQPWAYDGPILIHDRIAQAGQTGVNARSAVVNSTRRRGGAPPLPGSDGQVLHMHRRGLSPLVRCRRNEIEERLLAAPALKPPAEDVAIGGASSVRERRLGRRRGFYPRPDKQLLQLQSEQVAVLQPRPLLKAYTRAAQEPPTCGQVARRAVRHPVVP